MLQMSVHLIGQHCKKRTKSPSERSAGRYAVEVFEFFNKMCLVVIAVVIEKLVLAEALLGGFGTEDILKTHDLAESFGRVAYIVFEQPAELPGT